METILVRYFYAKLPNLHYIGDENYPYTKEMREQITDTVLAAGYNVLLQQTAGYMIIWIDKYRFQQR